MGKSIHLDDQLKEDYLGVHLFNELRWLLGAAVEWSLQEQLNLNIVGYDVQVYAMDSTFVHARALFEFFVEVPSKNHLTSQQFLDTVLTSANYSNWRDPLHRAVMHAQDRSRPVQLKTSGGTKDLNKMPVDFACEILRLWAEFEQILGKSNNAHDQKLQQLAREKRKEAIEKAKCVLMSKVAQNHAGKKRQLLAPIFLT